eukprot:GHVT01071677.1.p1 GENE.GHVT01071677.1~~GHVT01071677.1.p1  ORF type:complete len:157 (+),score=25.28 GHVT01071677.1:767-1237(+)
MGVQSWGVRRAQGPQPPLAKFKAAPLPPPKPVGGLAAPNRCHPVTPITSPGGGSVSPLLAVGASFGVAAAKYLCGRGGVVKAPLEEGCFFLTSPIGGSGAGSGPESRIAEVSNRRTCQSQVRCVGRQLRSDGWATFGSRVRPKGAGRASLGAYLSV